MDHFFYLCIMFVMFFVCSLQPCGHLLEKGWPFGSLVCYVLLCFCHFPMLCHRSGVVLDCIDSLSLPPYLLCRMVCASVRTIIHSKYSLS